MRMQEECQVSMIQMTLEDFNEEIKGELYSYNEMPEEKIDLWEKKFLGMLKNGKLKTIKVIYNKSEQSKTKLLFKDENEVFQIADGYYSAIVNNEEEKYWASL